jgi:hypothetical protein
MRQPSCDLYLEMRSVWPHRNERQPDDKRFCGPCLVRSARRRRYFHSKGEACYPRPWLIEGGGLQPSRVWRTSFGDAVTRVAATCSR